VRGRRDEPAVQRRGPLTSREQILALQRSAGNTAISRFMLARKRARPEAQSAEQSRWDRANALYEKFSVRGNGFWTKLGLQAQLTQGKPITAAPPTPQETSLFTQNYTTTYANKPEGYLEVTSIHSKDKEVYHINYFFPDGRIQANSNYGRSKVSGVVPLHNNTVLWLQFGLARKQQEQMPVAPTELFRAPIWNHETNEVIWLCLPEGQNEAEFAGGTDDMKALLGTENGIAAAYMVFDNQVAKGIAAIKASFTGMTGAMSLRFDQPATGVVTPVLDTASTAIGGTGLDQTPEALSPGGSAHVLATATGRLIFYEFADEDAAKRWDDKRESMEEGPAASFADKPLVLIERSSAQSGWLVRAVGDYGPIYGLLPEKVLRASK
jgi:hypothetical protein